MCLLVLVHTREVRLFKDAKNWYHSSDNNLIFLSVGISDSISLVPGEQIELCTFLEYVYSTPESVLGHQLFSTEGSCALLSRYFFFPCKDLRRVLIYMVVSESVATKPTNLIELHLNP